MVTLRRVICSSTLMLATLLLGGLRASAQGTPVADDYRPTINPANFSTTIDNPYYPLPVGAVWTYQGTSEDGAIEDELTVTGDTVTIMGVDCLAVQDVVSVDGEVTENTVDYYAQDSDGNVWYFGEDSSTVENGKVTGTEGSWRAGVDGAFPGLIMPASPQESLQYRQEYLAGEAEDMAMVIDTDASSSVQFGSFDHVLVTAEWTPLEPNSAEEKAYAPGVGVVSSKDTAGGTETLELVSYTGPTTATPSE
jgi:hypothetical protein